MKGHSETTPYEPNDLIIQAERCYFNLLFMDLIDYFIILV